MAVSTYRSYFKRAECLARACAVVCLCRPYFTPYRLSRRGFCCRMPLPAVYHTVPTVSPGLVLSCVLVGRMSHRADYLTKAFAVVCVEPCAYAPGNFHSCLRIDEIRGTYLYCRSTCHKKFNSVFGCHYAAETYHRNLNSARHLPNHSYCYGLDRRP